jgi:hypothetical protein
MGLLAKLEPLRRLIDGSADHDSAELIGSQARARSTAEGFLVGIAREASRVLCAEAFTPPGGHALIPGEFVIFLSPDDDKEWQGDKRRGLVQGLTHALGQRAKDLLVRGQTSAPSFAIELRVDGTLAKGQFRGKAIWDAETGRTFVSPRPTVLRTTEAAEQPRENELTVVSPRPRIVLYSVEALRGGERQGIFPVTKPEITIGRGSQAVEVDLPIRGDAEVSRLHAVLSRDDQGEHWLVAKGQNPVLLNNRELARNERAPVKFDDVIQICSFSLRLHQVAVAGA